MTPTHEKLTKKAGGTNDGSMWYGDKVPATLPKLLKSFQSNLSDFDGDGLEELRSQHEQQFKLWKSIYDIFEETPDAEKLKAYEQVQDKTIATRATALICHALLTLKSKPLLQVRALRRQVVDYKAKADIENMFPATLRSAAEETVPKAETASSSSGK